MTQLQVLLPGQTNAPGTALGYVGTPTAQSISADGGQVVTVNAVDNTFHIVGGINDSIQLSTSDSSASLPPSQTMNNGTVTFSTPNSILWGGQGSFTVTATDLTNPAILQATSASVTVGP
jgi:hypothetical protein